MKHICGFILFKLMGWKIEGSFPTDLKKYVIIVAPHTHWMDFIMGVLIKYSTSLPANYIGKASLFKPPFGFIFRAFGGTPVDRSKSNNLVDAVVDIFNSKDQFVFALAPEGTRKKVNQWKTGFYYIAKGAKVPIVRGVMDFGNKTFTIHPPFYTTEDKEADFKEMRSVYEGALGKIPEYS